MSEEIICVLCDRVMTARTKPRYVIEWETGEILGQAHTGCVKRQHDEKIYYPETKPTPAQIAFAMKLRPAIDEIRERNEGRKWDQLDFDKFLLARAVLFQVSSADEFARYPRVKWLTDYWYGVDGGGGSVGAKEEWDKLFEWIRSFSEETEEK